MVALLMVLLWWGGRQITADYLVEEVEDSLNCRLEIGEVEVRAVGLPSTVVLRKVRMAKRDEWVNHPLAERPALQQSELEIEEVRLAVSLLGLLMRTVDVKELKLVNPKTRLVLREDGSSNLAEIFRSAPDREERRRRKGKKTGGSLNVEEVGLLARLDGVALEGGELDMLVEKSGIRIEVRELSGALDAIEVDPAALEETNEARLALSGTVAFGWEEEGPLEGGFLEVEGEATAKLFDPETADLNPDLTGQLQMSEASWLSANLPPFNGMVALLGKLTSFGMKVGFWPERARFGRGGMLGLHYHEERFTALDPLALQLGDWELALLEESWLDLATDEHDISGELVAAESLSGLMHLGMEKSLRYLPDSIEEAVVMELDELWFREGRFFTHVRSHGELSDPDVDLENAFPDLKELTKEALEKAGKDKLQDLGEGLLDGLFD